MKNMPKDAMYFRYYFLFDNEEKVIYAFSEEEARKTFKEFFNAEAGELIKRENW